MVFFAMAHTLTSWQLHTNYSFMKARPLERTREHSSLSLIGDQDPHLKAFKPGKVMASEQFSQIIEKMRTRQSRPGETIKYYNYDEDDTLALILSDDFAAGGGKHDNEPGTEPNGSRKSTVNESLEPSKTSSRKTNTGRRRPPLSKEGREGRELLLKARKQNEAFRKPRLSLVNSAQQRQIVRTEDSGSTIDRGQTSLVTSDSLQDVEERIPSGNSHGAKLNREEWEAMALKKLRQRRLRQMAMSKGKVVQEEAKPRNVGGILTTEEAIASSSGRAFRAPEAAEGNWPKTKLHVTNSTAPIDIGTISGSSQQFQATEDSKQPDGDIPLNGHDLTKKEGEIMTELGLSEKERLLAVYLLSLGLTLQDLMRFSNKRRMAFETNPHAAAARVNYLRSLGVRNVDIPKLLVRHPQLLEYSIERTMQQRVAYLVSLGIPESRLGRIVTLCPTLLQHSVETGLKPRVRFLQEVVGISAHTLPMVVCRSPQILTQSIENSLQPKIQYLQSLGVDFHGISRMITRHPQLLHYSVQESMQPRVDFLRKIGLSKSEVARILVRLSQILCLSVEGNLAPKYDYLINQLGGDCSTVQSFPAFFSLSLEQRIKPRHQFLQTRKMLPEGPFPMKFLTQSDIGFCKMVRCSEEEYQAFKHSLMLKDFAKKFGKVRTLN